MIGYFGAYRFEVSEKSVPVISGFQRNTAPRFEKFERIGKKALTAFIAPGLDTFSFSIKADAALGVKPRELLDKWAQIAASGEPAMLVIGNKPLGTDMWVCTSASEDWETVSGSGKVLKGAVSLVFEEYMTE
jgi:phage protein U